MDTRHLIIALCGLCICLPGCKQREEAPSEKSATPAPAASLVMTDELNAKLAVADAADGQVDHVVAKCVMCRLGMDGKPDYTATVGDYSINLCSSTCKETFEKDPAKALLALKDQ